MPSPLSAIPGHAALLRELGWPDPAGWQRHWRARRGPGLAEHLWPAGLDGRWIEGLALPFLSRLERAAATGARPVIGLSALPGCGKSTLGRWLEAVAPTIPLAIAVVSIDDFHWPGEAMEARMAGNPWQAPRALPGSHDLEQLRRSLDRWQDSGTLQVPVFDRSLRAGKGDRAGWRELQAEVVVLEGWFLGVDPWTAEQEADAAAINRASPLTPTAAELAYRPTVCAALERYAPLWDRLAALWHLQAPSTAATVQWKEQQDALMQRTTGVAMEAAMFHRFLRMLQLAILPTALQTIARADTVVHIDPQRRIEAITLRPGAALR